MTPKDKKLTAQILRNHYPNFYYQLKKLSGGTLIGNYIAKLYKSRGYNSYIQIKDSCPLGVKFYKHLKGIIKRKSI